MSMNGIPARTNPPEPLPVSDPAPYPPIQVCGPNIGAARRIGQALACSKSELSAITAYQYQTWILAARQPDLAACIARIARVEMHHLDILGRLVAALGGDPKYCCDQHGCCVCWNSGMIRYNQDLRAILTGNIADEKGAAEFYRETARTLSDPMASTILNRLALDEMLHVRIFTDFLHQLCG
jgi:hypothetical protein